MVYRLAGEGADHYFLLNEGERKKLKLKFDQYQYQNAQDPVTSEKFLLDAWILLDDHSARWIRYKK
ncbi:MAG: hypothetical protein WD431_12960 [Cyclobacteriaceae bacterium]